MGIFKLHSPFKPAGDQPQAIEKLVKNLGNNSALLGVTGSGKTYTLANVIAQQDKPVLILSPNKTLAAQLYEEFSLFFPQNKVCYFVSFYDYYQPESYLPAQNIYIPKEIKVNNEIERLRVESTASVMGRPDTIIIASVSCIYSLGDPSEYKDLAFDLKVGQEIDRYDLLKQLIFIQYMRSDEDKISGSFSVVGDTVEICLPYNKERLRIEMMGDAIESLSWISSQTNAVLEKINKTTIYPAKHFVTSQDKKKAAIESIKTELKLHLPTIQDDEIKNRLEERVNRDLEMIQELGYCSGIENYSAHFEGRKKGVKPHTLFDFFDNDFLFIIDESHISIPQLGGMFHGDAARKKNLIEYGFRLPSAADNRPLKHQEVEQYMKNTIFVSATPGEYELENSTKIVEQIIRPTGLVDPPIEIHKRDGQIEDLIKEIKSTAKKGFRSLVTVLTKKTAEDLARFLEEQEIKVCYMHGEIKTPERTELLHKLRLGVFDCLVGVNLIREGLDLPEVALVAIMDADVESFLRDKRSMIQTAGRAARNTESKVVLYADKITKSMQQAIDECSRRRQLQLQYNEEHGIVPRSAQRSASKGISNIQEAIAAASKSKKAKRAEVKEQSEADMLKALANLEVEMQRAAESLNFEKAIQLRAEWRELKEMLYPIATRD